ncbi:MAG: hypothetical protein OEU92_01935 [Alphaproteobacteria bacterium]|nr:hypothetical protein [Alphaproteobacteria bacterium]
MIKRALAGVALLMAMVASLEGAAAARAADLDVLIRSLNFLIDPPAGNVDLAVVYDSASSASSADARNIVDLAKDKKGAGFTLVPRLIDERSLEGLGSAELVLLAAGADALFAPVFAQARANKTLVVSLHQNCIDLDLCVMWVKGKPDVRIVLNRAAAQLVNARFNTTFRMMVQER